MGQTNQCPTRNYRQLQAWFRCDNSKKSSGYGGYSKAYHRCFYSIGCVWRVFLHWKKSKERYWRLFSLEEKFLFFSWLALARVWFTNGFPWSALPWRECWLKIDGDKQMFQQITFQVFYESACTFSISFQRLLRWVCVVNHMADQNKEKYT